SAISTFATTLRYHRTEDDVYQSAILQMYLDSLRHMGKALYESRGTFHIEHCAAIMCLAVTAILTPMVGSGWMTHAKGVGDLIEHLGPERFSSGLFHVLFVGFRPLLLVSSLLNRHATFLAKQEWTTVPFRSQSVFMMQRLLDRASALPSLLERYYNITDFCEHSNSAVTERLCQDFHDFLEGLQEWEQISRLYAQDPLLWSRANAVGSSTAADDLWFPNIMTANSLTHYWAFKIIAKTHLGILHEAMTTPIYSLRGTLAPATQTSFADLAEMIYNSMSYLNPPDIRLHNAGSSFFTFPTAISGFQRSPDRYSSQLSRCKQIVNKLRDRGIYFNVFHHRAA
ncbi:hypothetical protein EK21DRAFT_66971, partial [Setomelanomma holmii]